MRIFSQEPLRSVKVLRYMDIIHGMAPEVGAELGQHVLPDLGGEARHHGLDDGHHDKLGRLRVLHMLLRHRSLLPELVCLP